jgi:hypothetical protein
MRDNCFSMDRKLQILLAAGITITIVTFFINTYAAGIVFIVLATLVMSYLIMQDSTFLPDVTAEIKDDAKAVIIRNTGNAVAVKVHVALVPENLEFDLPSLAVEGTHLYPLERMVENVRVVITFENEKGDAFSRSFTLSGRGENFDPLKPMIPLFKYK